MGSFPGAEEVLAAYLDQVEALERLLHARATISADPRSRFHGLVFQVGAGIRWRGQGAVLVGPVAYVAVLVANAPDFPRA
jgi:hypothetical protein